MKKYVFESLKFFCAAILCLCLSAFTSPSWGALPSGYTELEYIESTGTQYIDTGIVGKSGVSAEAKFMLTTDANGSLLGNRQSDSTRFWPAMWFKGTGSSVLEWNATVNVDTTAGTVNKNTLYTTYFVSNSSGWTFDVNGERVSSGTEVGSNTNNMWMFGTNDGRTNTLQYPFIGKVYSAKIWQNATLVRNFIPAKNSSGVVGMYDTVNNRFYTNAGTGEFVAGAPVTDNSCRNLFNPAAVVEGYEVSGGTGVRSSSGWWVSDYIPVKGGEPYTFSSSGERGGAAIFLCKTIGTRDVIEGESMTASGVFPLNAGSRTYTIPSGYNFLVINGRISDTADIQIERGSTPTPYQPYNPSCGCDGTVVNYVSATGTGVQNGTPTPDNPIDPVFYQQGNMILRAVGDYADSYDATTGKITRRVGVKVLDGTESWSLQSINQYGIANFIITIPRADSRGDMCSHFQPQNTMIAGTTTEGFFMAGVTSLYIRRYSSAFSTIAKFKEWLASEYANGTPVTVYYPLATEVEEDWPASYCETPIKIATTKYNESAFGPLNTALQNAISVVDSVVSNTITQAGRIADLQTQKQTRPADDTCPAYKQCLLVEDENGKPHWYEITDPFRDFVTPIIANNVAPTSTTNDAGYTQLEYIRSTQTQYIDTGITGTQDTAIETKFVNMLSDSTTSVLIGDGWNGGSYLLSIVSQTGAPNRIGGLNNSLKDFWRTGQEFVVKMDKTGLYVNNSKIQWGGSATEFTTTKPLYLLGDPAASNRNSSATLYYMKIYNNGTLVRNFIPAQRNSDGAVGMYDTVGQRFYGNAASSGDDFTAGPTVANTDVPANPTWMRAWDANAQYNLSAGKVYGTAQCNNLSGTQEHAQKATSAQTASSGWLENGAKCWCKVVGVELDNESIEAPATASWVFDAVRSSVEDCNKMCVAACSNRVLGEAAFRKALFED